MDRQGPPFDVDPGAMEALASLWRAGHGAYLVGGGVRDALLGLEVGDWDIATDAVPERILAIFPGSTYQNRFGTVLARDLEITTFRREHRYADHRRPDMVVFSDDVYEDLARRDLTINAIAWGRMGPEADGRLVDPADGQGDLQAGLVRAVGDPARRFDEDALRLLRAVRIAARLGFQIEPLTWQAMQAHAADMEYVSADRIGSEVRRMLAASSPSRAFRLLRDSGILAATLPELAGTANPDAALEALDRASAAQPDNERLALAALLGQLSRSDVRRTLDRLRLPGRSRAMIVELVVAARAAYTRGWNDADVRRYLGRVRAELIDDLLVLRRARAGGDEAALLLEAELAERVATELADGSPLTLAQLAVDGRDLCDTLGLAESPTIGTILARLLADVVEDPALNTRDTLLTRAGHMLDDTPIR